MLSKGNALRNIVAREDPEIDVIALVDIPDVGSAPNYVDREFWLRLITRLKLLDTNQALRITWANNAYTHVNSGCYHAAHKLGIKVSVCRQGNCSYVWRR